ncbi:MAG: hypothetical protein ACREUH_09130 [Burkholderiales bacterium]
MIHRHRVGNQVSRRVSELLFVDGHPRALLAWIDLGGVRTPLYICELDPTKLRPPKGNTYYYDAVTVDPRFEELPELSAARTR